MFAVFGVCKTHCQKDAEKYVMKRLKDADRVTDIEARIAERARQRFENKKALKKIAGPYSCPRIAREFIKLATEKGEARGCVIRQRVQTDRVHPKTKKPVFEWREVGAHG